MTDVRLEPMTEQQYRAYREVAEQSYADSIAESGVARADAVEQAAKSFADLLPEGLGTPDHHLFTVYDGDTDVGILWLRIKPGADGPRAFGFDFEIREQFRRRGYGRAVMVAAEQRCRDLEVAEIGLHVFAHNEGARSLYEQMGYEVTSYNMRKKL
ncbi:GNAT family N-acetyltransferase [Micromonosporaceae bacterium Da 78-11]